jgi:hypothetical protein
MNATDMENLITLYSQGKVPEDYFRSTLAQYRKSNAAVEESPLQTYYKSLSETSLQRASEYSATMQSARAELERYVKSEFDNFVAQRNNSNRLWADAGLGHNLFKLIDKESITYDSAGNPVLDMSKVSLRSAQDILKAGTSKRGYKTPWAKIAEQYAMAELNYADYASRRDTALSKYTSQIELDRIQQEEAFAKRQQEVLSTAERMLSTNRKAYTERSL